MPVTDLSKEALRKLLMSRYHGSWKRMFIHHPHLRYDGLYVSRNTYVQVRPTPSQPPHTHTCTMHTRFATPTPATSQFIGNLVRCM
jgi:hypothetical protein